MRSVSTRTNEQILALKVRKQILIFCALDKLQWGARMWLSAVARIKFRIPVGSAHSRLSLQVIVARKIEVTGYFRLEGL
jgi:hypothetical protein